MKKIKPVEAFGILNAYGQFWTPKTFHDRTDAENYMEAFWGNMENPPDMAKHKVIPVLITPLTKKK